MHGFHILCNKINTFEFCFHINFLKYTLINAKFSLSFYLFLIITKPVFISVAELKLKDFTTKQFRYVPPSLTFPVHLLCH